MTTGADGDIFHTKITWKDQALVFAIVEREDGRVIDSTELWSLTDGGKTLKRVPSQRQDQWRANNSLYPLKVSS